ncbi:hypothetical protein Ahy_B08g089211 [Arachis hypogaea]|uniref:Uncharacterized protein n=1 Tax=Arachis hypogaea TaxID=3818 RepID=A0A444XX14_ARAHY|nr:hypothetical protein Ahy_B08g089211 [Arachis hypogaea]
MKAAAIHPPLPPSSRFEKPPSHPQPSTAAATTTAFCFYLSPPRRRRARGARLLVAKSRRHRVFTRRRPNVSEMSVNAANNFGAQVVIVTSNPQGSRDVVNACKANGIAAFGPIWDS